MCVGACVCQLVINWCSQRGKCSEGGQKKKEEARGGGWVASVVESVGRCIPLYLAKVLSPDSSPQNVPIGGLL